MRLAKAAIQLTRPDTSLLSFLAVFVPMVSRTSSLSLSIERAAPLLFVSMCTFIVNDLDDIEKDRINHPDRPLPSGRISPSLAALLYYICLSLALLTIRTYIEANEAAFLYYLLLVVAISYNYVVEFLPAAKSAYVATAASIPIVIVAVFYPQEEGLYFVAAANFFFNLGRELCMDIGDRSGDPKSLLHDIKPHRIASFAFKLQAAGLILLFPEVENHIDLFTIATMISLFALSCYTWFILQSPRPTILIMKITIFGGLYFLV